jgi:putative membrane protein
MFSRTAVAALALASLVACSKDNDADTTASNDTSSVATQAPPPAPELTDANILAGLIAGDSMDIALGTAMKAQATNPGLKTLGSMLIADHTQHIKDVMAVATKDSVTPVLMAGDTSVQHRENIKTTWAALTKGASADSSFVQTAIDAHQAGLDRMDNYDGKAQNADVKALVEATKPVMQKHLDAAKALKDKMEDAAKK